MFAPLSRLARRMRMRVTEEILHIVEIEDGYVRNDGRQIYTYVIDKLHTTEVITHTRGGCANRHRGGAEVSICITTECMCDNLSSV